MLCRRVRRIAEKFQICIHSKLLHSKFRNAATSNDASNKRRLHVNSSKWIAISLVICAALLLAALPGYGQLPTDPVERAKVVAQFFEANARRLTLFDREGKEISVVGPRDVYNQPVLSPDRTRVAVIKVDLDKENANLWVLDIATGKGTQITASQSREQTSGQEWTP